MTFKKKHQAKVFNYRIFLSKFSIIILLCLVFFSFCYASFTSSSFELENPSTTVIEGGQASSSSFQYFSSLGQLVQGQSTSSSFGQNAGFLYFPTASSPIVSTSSGNAQVIVSWTTAVGVFANITSYSVGISTTANGTYTYTNVGNVLTSTRTGLNNGTTYFFKVKSFAAGLALSESVAVSGTPTAPTGGTTTGGSGGGGSGGAGGAGGSGGGAPPPPSPTVPAGTAKVTFFGKAYPNSTITLLKDSQIIAQTIAGSDANFNIVLSNVASGNYVFGVYGTDNKGVKSILYSFPLIITDGVTINVGGIFIAPTISGDKSQVKQGDNITFFGQAVPESEVTIAVHSNEEVFQKVVSDKNGIYLKTMDTSVLEVGSHNAKSKVADGAQISIYSKPYNFAVGTTNEELKDTKCPAKADLNNDCRVDLIDFSIAAYWYKKTLSGSITTLENNKLNSDGKITLVDFSIMAYYWTG